MLIPDSFLDDDRAAIIVPAFEYMPKLRIRNHFEQVMAGYIDDVPRNKTELAACMNTNTNKCTIFRATARLHVIPLMSSNS